ncbi:probable serine/threonine-protein kinase PBL28 isoform X3 [Pyrus x bretschneideri]|uniref:probable serine/threonine-protein kinase PBL28 isoform X3 n=1 Tax=Pyrus x bretschneideri TaxID=225117 RepID=UPI00202FA449|nr:probable serine/threonine-protein kinase PBL28 isoform X3 [Pyrus x bretschneideri]
MRLFWWQQLPLLILIHLLEPSRTSYKVYAEALLTFKSDGGSPQLLKGRIGRCPCLTQWKIVNCHKLKDPCVVSLYLRCYTSNRFSGICSVPLWANAVSLPPFVPRLFITHSSIQLQKGHHKPRSRRIAAIVDGDNGTPTLTPVEKVHGNHSTKPKVAAIIGGVVATLLVIIVVMLIYMCLMRVKRLTRQTSETVSSAPSPPVQWERGDASPYTVAHSPYSAPNLRQLTILELEQATSNFSETNIISQGRFGLVYKGLLQDGTIVAIKRRLHAPTQYFFHEVKHVARVNHMHILRLIGYCQDATQQLLVYDYLPNGNVGNHLYDAEGLPIGRLGIRQRLLIALGAAKGLAHLRSLVPPLLHMHFRTSNVLLDENFTAKVSDYGLTKLLVGHHAGSSSAVDCFVDPELDSSKKFSERSDVYSFGVFLLELVSGREANARNQLNSVDNLILQAKDCKDLGRFVDKTLGDKSWQTAKQMMELALMCVDGSERRPQMQIVVEVLERIHRGRESSHFHIEVDEEIGAVTLGSELFK